MSPQDPVHLNRQLARGSHLGDDEVLLMTAEGVLLAEVGIEANGDVGCLDQEKPMALREYLLESILSVPIRGAREEACLDQPLLGHQ